MPFRGVLEFTASVSQALILAYNPRKMINIRAIKTALNGEHAEGPVAMATCVRLLHNLVAERLSDLSPIGISDHRCYQLC